MKDDTFAAACRKADAALRKTRGRDKAVSSVATRQPASRSPTSLADFRAYMPMHSYIFAPTRELWPAASVNARVPPVPGANGNPMRATEWLDQNAAVEQMTWAPGEPMLIKDRLIADGGWFRRPGAAVFNLYRPPAIVPKAGDVTPWLKLIEKVFPDDDIDHIVRWLAQRVQRPHEKINHALVLGGKPGIGKDSMLEPVKQAVGPWNVADVSPSQVLGRFNGFRKSVILRVSEARDLGDFDRYKFHDHMKALIAAPPDVLYVDEKNTHEYYVPNLCGVVITSNHKTDGIYLPADDPGISWRGRTSAPRTSPRITGASSTATTPTAATRPSPHILRASTYLASTRRRHRRRPQRFGRSSTPTAPPRTPSWPTCSTRSLMRSSGATW
jgi:hypothetical protein